MQVWLPPSLTFTGGYRNAAYFILYSYRLQYPVFLTIYKAELQVPNSIIFIVFANQVEVEEKEKVVFPLGL